MRRRKGARKAALTLGPALRVQQDAEVDNSTSVVPRKLAGPEPVDELVERGLLSIEESVAASRLYVLFRASNIVPYSVSRIPALEGSDEALRRYVSAMNNGVGPSYTRVIVHAVLLKLPLKEWAVSYSVSEVRAARILKRGLQRLVEWWAKNSPLIPVDQAKAI